MWLIVYIGCGLVLLAGLAVGAYAMLGLEREQVRIQAQSSRRVAMDRIARELDLVILGRFLLPESARDPREYQPFYPQPALINLDRFVPVDEAEDVAPWVASPLLRAALGEPSAPHDADPAVLLHFEVLDGPRADVVSPTAWPEWSRDNDRLLTELLRNIELATGRLPSRVRERLEPHRSRRERLFEIIGGRGVAFADDELELEMPDAGHDAPPRGEPGTVWSEAFAELRRALRDDPLYADVLRDWPLLERELSALASERPETRIALDRLLTALADPEQRAAAAPGFRAYLRQARDRAQRERATQAAMGLSRDRDRLLVEGAEVGESRFVWRRDLDGEAQLFLMRELSLREARKLQGVWIDWASLRGELATIASDLAPGASIEPVLDASGLVPGVRLAQAPMHVRLAPAQEVNIEGMTPTRWAIVTMCATVIGAYLAVGLALQGSAALAARRGRFVSAVTHELRTPLTTFRLYTEMLADGLIRDETKKAEYLSTLKTESERLSSIVENVLTYAKLRPGRRLGEGAETLSAFVERVEGPLQRRAEQEAMTLELDAPDLEGVRMLARGATV
ncbi:MAG: histidine kinase dimerization/phospho-acceptor domain-containing protein, partial [Planctomycetota bacterium]